MSSSELAFVTLCHDIEKTRVNEGEYRKHSADRKDNVIDHSFHEREEGIRATFERVLEFYI